MPELPEVQTVLNGLTEVLNGSTILALECNYPGTVINSPFLATDPLPDKVIGFERRGKYIIVHLKMYNALIIHLRMTGKLVFDPNSTMQNKHQRACLLLQEQRRILFIDPRTFGKIVFCKNEEILKYITALGPEPLSMDFNSTYLFNVLKNKTAPIKNTLLDQRIVAGLGNIYVSEILFRAGILPQTPSKLINKEKLESIAVHTKDVLTEAIAQNGTTLSDFRRIDDKSGQFQNFLRVYQKTECPMGHKIERIRLAGRSSFYCPVCQK